MLAGCASSNFVGWRANEDGGAEYAHEFQTGTARQRPIAGSAQHPILERSGPAIRSSRDEPSNENPMTERDRDLLTSPRGTMGQELSRQYEGASLLSPTSTLAELRALEKNAQSQKDIFDRRREPKG